MKDYEALDANSTSMRTFRRLGWVTLLLILLFSSLVWVAGAQKPEGDDDLPSLPAIDPALRLKIEPALFKQLIEGDGGRVPIVLEMKMTPDIETALAESDPDRRRQAVVANMQTTAQASQVGALTVLAEREAVGGAADIRSFWIFNGLAAEADLKTILALAALPEVKIVRRDREYHISDRVEVLPDTFPDAQSVGSNIAQVRADLVWNALKVDGAGTVVANIDSGVDFLHPALHTRYRGYDQHGLHIHSCNWFDATGGGATYPVDGNGHGTHTMGTIAGGEGIGVAPGATWIAVRAFDNQGFGLESWLHAAMQWVVDPGPGCSPPDVVSNSWSNAWGGTDVFRTDVQVMRAAGIFAPFSAGNDGAGSASIDAPASYPEAFGVGAVTEEDDIASFSSRGPSTWYGVELTKPEVSAPGVNVRSSLPGGTYGENDGTSMAAPHAAGLAALMLQADPSLSVDELETIIKETSLPLGASTPNNAYGWGRIDAYAAVASVANSGTVIGLVTRADDGVPISNARLVADPSTSGPPAMTLTSNDGAYDLALAPDRYTLMASAFGYIPVSRVVEVVPGTTLIEDFILGALPSGTLIGRVTGDGQPLADVKITVDGTPMAMTTDASGVYTAWLPAGSYTLTVVSSGYRVGVATDVPITVGETTTRDFDLVAAPTILVVDSGAWYYSSQIDYYRQALDELRYAYDLWTVRDPIEGVPAEGDLLPYDIVFWSSPEDSPGYLDASSTLITYLDSGGSLFISGQDVAYYDDFYPFIYAPYFRKYLKASYVTDDTGVRSLTGVPDSLFGGLTFDIEGPGGADNQFAPDGIGVLASDYASSIVSYDVSYESGSSGGQQVGQCLNYRTIYLAYGFEAITDVAVRTEIISRSIEWLTAPPRTAGIELTPGDQSMVGNFGQTVIHPLRVRNLAEIGAASDITVTPVDFIWPTSIDSDHVTLRPCEWALIDLAVQVPPAADWAASDLATVVAESATVVATATRETRAPAPVLLVDDDRWYNVEDHYRNALDANGVLYDIWQIPWNSSIGDSDAAPPATILHMYPMVSWFSASDWYQPLTPVDEGRLAYYLEGGGRLYYNGQDYLFSTDGPNDFAREYLGVADFTEDFTSTSVVGLIGSPIGSSIGPYDLVYPYKNFSDALTPTGSADVAFVGQEGQPNAVTNGGLNPQGGNIPWRTTFFAFNPDGLSGEALAHLMRRVIGWLSWLGGSTVNADKAIALDTDVLTYTIVLQNDGWQDMASASFTATFTNDLTPIPGSVSGGASWNPGLSAFVWSGPLNTGQSLTFTYQAAIAGPLPMGHVVSHTVWMGYDNHKVEFDRTVATPVNLPILSQSSFSVNPVVAEVGNHLTYTLRVRNTGVVDGLVSVHNPLPAGISLVPGSLQASGGTTSLDDGRVIVWIIPVAVGNTATLSYTAIVTDVPPGLLLRNRATLDDGLGNVLLLDATARISNPIFLPIVFK